MFSHSVPFSKLRIWWRDAKSVTSSSNQRAMLTSADQRPIGPFLTPDCRIVPVVAPVAVVHGDVEGKMEM